VFFRGKFLDALKRHYRRHKLLCAGPSLGLAESHQFHRFIRSLYKKDWVVYAKPAFGDPIHVLRYLGRYTHRVAISNHRLVSFDGERVTFRWKDYAHGSQKKVMTLSAIEFQRRFFLHVLPKGFVRIRHFGFLANRFRSPRLALGRKLLATVNSSTTSHLPSLCQATSWHCPRCDAVMVIVQRFQAHELRWPSSTFDSS
jgi:Putative transposase